MCYIYSKQNENGWCLFSRKNGISKDTESEESEGHSGHSWYSRLIGGENSYGNGGRDRMRDEEKRKVSSR